ncbi:MAG: anion transporter [Alphaproteobacteria bacterium]|nr:anion transporter [Alphaproteobacteria bacterium]
MTAFVLVVFAVTYVGMALGRLPGLAIDRSGMALVAAVLVVVARAVAPESVAAAIHFPTLILLFALMIVSARFAAAGLYDWIAARIAAAAGSPHRLLALTIAIGGGLSAVLVNDVVVFVMTPLLVRGLVARDLDPRPFLAALAGAANAGSAATIIGNPQNIVIGQVGALDFVKFLAVCGPPALAALVVIHLVVARVWADELRRTPGREVPALPPVERDQTIKAALATAALLVLFLTPVPRELSALAVAAVLLLSRRFASRTMLTAVDWPLLLLFTGLFVVNRALADTGLTAEALAWARDHALFPDRLAVLLPGALLVSNTIGNVPAVIALLAAGSGWSSSMLYGLALTTTLAGNFFLVGSIANLIVAERAASVGACFGFREHARAGVPMTLISMAIAAAWLWGGGWLGW